jgi:hypothetical protein
MSAVKFFVVTSAQYTNLAVKDDSALYFLSDQNRIFKGETPYTHPVELVTEFPATGLVGTLYVNTESFEVKAWNGTAWITVQLAVSKTVADTDEQLPTSGAVKRYVDDTVEELLDGGVVTDVTYADKKLTIVKGENSSTPLQLTGLLDGASFDGATGKLTFTTNGGTPVEINLPVEQFLSAAAYDEATHILTLTMTDNTTFDVDLADLIDTYNGVENSAIKVDITDGSVEAELKISAAVGNILKINEDGIYAGELAWQTIEEA